MCVVAGPKTRRDGKEKAHSGREADWERGREGGTRDSFGGKRQRDDDDRQKQERTEAGRSLTTLSSKAQAQVEK